MAKKPLSLPPFVLSSGQKIYFASDFHLGAPNKESSEKRESKVIEWLEFVSKDAKAIFLVGDIFDFWFEYKHTIPKGFLRFQGKLAELRSRNIPIYLFTGNHDLWLSSYFPDELGIPVFKDPISTSINDRKILVGHGDGLGPGDHFYKFLKSLFTNRFCRWLFKWLHPDIGISIAKYWSNKSRSSKVADDAINKGEDERLFQYAIDYEKAEHQDYYVFGHRHLPFKMEINTNSTYFSLGDWINHCSYLEIDEKEARLKSFDH